MYKISLYIFINQPEEPMLERGYKVFLTEESSAVTVINTRKEINDQLQSNLCIKQTKAVSQLHSIENRQWCVNCDVILICYSEAHVAERFAANIFQKYSNTNDH